MVVRQLNAWSITFRTFAFTGGYQWLGIRNPVFPEDVSENWGLVRRMVAPGQVAGMQFRNGLEEARRAERAFRQLAEDVIVRGIADDNETNKQRIVVYADRFGGLYGEDVEETYRDWLRELADYLDLYDVARALERSDLLGEFDRRVKITKSEINYRRKHHAAPWLITKASERMEEINEGIADPMSVHWFDKAKEGGPRARAWMLFCRQAEQHMAGGLSLEFDPLDENYVQMAPRGVLHLVYARTWLDIVTRKHDVKVIRRCRNCGKELEGGRSSRQFCDGTCRKAFHRRRGTSENGSPVGVIPQ